MTSAPTSRLPGPDVVRAVAMLGVVVMNYHGYLILRGGERPTSGWAHLLDPWTGPFATRFAATFVLTAGVGATLLTRSTRRDHADAVSWLLVRRGVLLVAGGRVFDWIWPGTILPFYGAMFITASVLVRLRSRWIVLIGSTAAIGAAALRWWRLAAELAGRDTRWLTDPGPRSPRGLLFDLFVNGTHPLLPWLAFFGAGLVVGRVLTTSWWRPVAAGAGCVALVTATIANAVTASSADPVVRTVGSLQPFDRGLLYTSQTLGIALLAFVGVSWVADRASDSMLVDVLRRAGRMSLTIYLAHALVFVAAIDVLGLVEPGGPATSLVAAIGVWGGATVAAVAYERRFGRGPAERLYRRLTG
ncbi:MAG: DUF418 domain-containing protein [Ilumatobacteraceae bacterium]